MESVTLGLSVLLAAGVLAAKAGQKIKLPSVTGYILAGLFLGPSGLDWVTSESIGTKLNHFTEIALMMIAFGIGEHIELKRLRTSIKSIGLIGLFETSAAFFFVGLSCFVVAIVTGLNSSVWTVTDYLFLSLFLGVISIATAPASTLHVVRELKARGVLSSTLMAVVAIDNGLAIMFFGFIMTIAGQMTGTESASMTTALVVCFSEVSFSLLLGILTGLIISLLVPSLNRQEEILTAALAILLLCGEVAYFFNLSSMLAGMAAGFTVVNRVTRDVRVFRALNAFEPPIYLLFFTLAGTHLDIAILGSAGWVGFVYFVFRVLGKFCGSYFGAFLASAPLAVKKYLGFALVPQAGVAIALIFLVSSDPNLAGFAEIITPVVLAGIILSEISGPVCVRYAVEKAKESRVAGNGEGQEANDTSGSAACPAKEEEIRLVPWSWKKLQPQPNPQCVVAFGASHPLTVGGLARFATIFAHHYQAAPMAIRVVRTEDCPTEHDAFEALFSVEEQEVKSIGYPLQKELICSNDVVSSLVAAVEYNNAQAVVLGYPLPGTAQGFQDTLEAVVSNVACPIIVVRFFGVLHTENILVPLRSMDDLHDVGPIIHALSKVGEHQITLLYLLSAEEEDDKVGKKTQELVTWADELQFKCLITFKVERTEARQETILAESVNHDVVVMGTSRKHVLKRIFFGSLAETLARDIKKPMLIIYRPTQLTPSLPANNIGQPR